MLLAIGLASLGYNPREQPLPADAAFLSKVAAVVVRAVDGAIALIVLGCATAGGAVPAAAEGCATLAATEAGRMELLSLVHDET